MINKKSFVKIMNGMRDYWDGIMKLETLLNIQMESGLLVNISDAIMDALVDDVETDNNDEFETPWLYYFAFELDWGRSDRAKNNVTVDDVIWELDTAEKLYDLLVYMRNKGNNNEQN